jgi:rhamnosyl/mannosyltransferase
MLHKIAIPIIDASFGKYILRRSDLVLAVNPFEMRWLKEMGVKNVEMVPDCIPDFYLGEISGEKFRGKYGIEERMVLSVGRHHPSKGFEDLIKIAKDFPDTVFVIVGPKTKYTKKLVELAEKLNVINRIIFTDEISEEEKLQAYAACDVFCLPTRFEAFGITILEAMSQGKPVIVNDVGGVPFVVPDKVCLTKVRNLKSLKEKLNLMLTNEELAEEIGRMGKEKARQFVWSKIGEKYCNLLERFTVETV